MEQWVGQKIALVLADGLQLRGTLIKADYNGNVIIETAVGTNHIPSKCFVPERSYEMAYIVPDEAVFSNSTDNWAGNLSLVGKEQ